MTKKLDFPWLRPELVASWRELIAVLVILVGYPAYISALAAFHGSSKYYQKFFESNSWLLHNIAEDSAVLALMLFFLRWRGWNSEDLKIRIGWWASLQSVVLMIAVKVSNALTVVALLLFVFGVSLIHNYLMFIGANGLHSKNLSFAPVDVAFIMFQIINAYSEELTCMAYGFNQFAAKRGPLFALIVTVLMRMLWHTYQGPINMLGFGVVFLIFGVYYWFTRNLWPLILAHFLLDVVPINLIAPILGHL